MSRSHIRAGSWPRQSLISTVATDTGLPCLSGAMSAMHSVHRGGGGEEILDRHRSRHLGPPPIVTAVYVSISTPV